MITPGLLPQPIVRDLAQYLADQDPLLIARLALVTCFAMAAIALGTLAVAAFVMWSNRDAR